MYSLRSGRYGGTSIPRAVLALLVLASIASLPALSGAHAAQTVTVLMQDSFYQPQTATISVGDTILWNNTGTVVHDAVADSGQAVTFDSGDLDSGMTYRFTFTVAGNFSYHCKYHPEMVGNIVVQNPVPEFPGPVLFAAVGLAVLMGLALERGFRTRGNPASVDLR